jgi:hypothetical protein
MSVLAIYSILVLLSTAWSEQNRQLPYSIQQEGKTAGQGVAVAGLGVADFPSVGLERKNNRNYQF